MDDSLNVNSDTALIFHKPSLQVMVTMKAFPGISSHKNSIATSKEHCQGSILSRFSSQKKYSLAAQTNQGGQQPN